MILFKAKLLDCERKAGVAWNILSHITFLIITLEKDINHRTLEISITWVVFKVRFRNLGRRGFVFFFYHLMICNLVENPGLIGM